MTLRKAILGVACLASVAALRSDQAAIEAVIVNREGAKWVHEAKDPAGAESVTIREDRVTGGLELLVRYPGGHVFPPHWHDANERIILLSGRLSFRRGDQENLLEPGGFAYLPAREPQRLSCASKDQCVFYVLWDGSPRSHAVK
jgi:quercetin dioxygenase-like cupin family protein